MQALETEAVQGAAEHSPGRGTRPGRSRALPGRQPLSPDPEGREGAAGPPPSAPAMGPRRRTRKPEVPRRRTASPAPSPPRRGPRLGNPLRPLALEPASLQPGCEVGTAGSACPFHRPENRARVRSPGPNLPTSGWRSPAVRLVLLVAPARVWAKFQAPQGNGESS